MLHELFKYLSKDYSFFAVFDYLTMRALLASATALVIGLIAGPKVIRKLLELKVGQAVRQYGLESHLVKDGTPTMGGVLVLIAIALSTLLWADLSNRFVWVVLFVTVGFGAVGWFDDYRKVVYRNPEGMSSREKFFWQSTIGAIAALYLTFAVAAPENAELWPLFKEWVMSGFTMPLPRQADLIVPFFKSVSYPLGVFGFAILTWLVIVGSSNAVNLTDGLDGLAIMPTIMVAGGLGIFAYASGNANIAQYLGVPKIPGAGELLVFCAAIFGAGLGFLWFNTYPAQVFMGDVGALALGAALGIVAVIVRQEIVLAIMGGVFVLETLSVIMQVGYFKLTGGKRIFRMAPLHHHYEKKGWPEPRVIVRFWIITVILVMIGLSSLKIR